jgi:hypothetical protein
VFWVISVYFNIRNILPKSGRLLLGHLAYQIIQTIVAQFLVDTYPLDAISVGCLCYFLSIIRNITSIWEVLCVATLLHLANDTRIRPRNNIVLYDDTVSC